MKLIKTIIFFIIFCGLHHFSPAQLGAGDIAIVGYNSDNPDGFTFMALNNIPGSMVIHFTDKGWKADGSFRDGEGIISWASPNTVLSSGTLVNIYNSNSWETDKGSITGSVTLASGADQILAFTGSESSPVFLAAINFNSKNGWDDDATATDESALPAGLINDSTALALPAWDNSVYSGPLPETQSNLPDKINNPGNWYGSNTFHFNLAAGTFPYNVLLNSGDWETSSNWKTKNVPGSETSVIITEDADIAISADANCKNLFLESRATVLIESGNTLTIQNNLALCSRTATYAAAIINNGTLNVSGTTNYHRWIQSKDRHIVSSPVADQALNEFALTNSIQYFEEGADYNLAPYDEPTDSWTPYTTESNNNPMTPGKGYAMHRKIEANTSSFVSFTGTLNQSDVSVTLTRNNQGWNCIGNPFASPLTGTGANSFLEVNSDQLDPEFTGLYLWDYQEDDYIVYSNANSENIAPCQGFIVKSKTGAGTVNLTTNMQVFASPSFKSEEIPWPSVNLSVSDGTVRNSTRIVFNDEMTTGLDPGYDVGKLKGNPSFALYSKLPEDSEADFAVQALPLLNHETRRIPIGFDFETGGEVTFRANIEELPDGMQAILEDIHTGIKTRLDNQGAEYIASVAPGSAGYGRFYLHTGEQVNTSSPPGNSNRCRMNIHDRQISLTLPDKQAVTVSLYNINGKPCQVPVTRQLNVITLDTSGLPKGIYILTITGNGYRHTEKIILNQ